MTRPVVTAREEDTLDDVARLMLAHKIGCVPIVGDDGRLSGILTAFDFVPRDYRPPFGLTVWRGVFGLNIYGEPLHEIYRTVRSMRAGEVMSRPVVSVTEDAEVDEAVNKLVVHRIDHLPVVCDGAPVGMLTRHDLLLLLT